MTDTEAGTPPEWIDLAADIRAVDANHDLGAGNLAAALTARGWTRRPATDPAGLDALRASMETFVAAREADVRANRDAPDNINELVAAVIRGWLARLSVADGPGPEKRP